ncbi:hypothetical protein CC78DRAFT_504426 [Lojkania enalia]|uniref:CUE domain-containing protein n=1 Tax=Lojkania enalia TaxID=147567 RepID=A0A9P4N1B6_9PLEO|nr:hypothetical protein CC78DRAFT_504426 [Didymosphaeria enalia]
MDLPTFAPFPQADLRQSIPPAQWELYLESWAFLSELYLRLNDQDFSSNLSDEGSLAAFLVSFFQSLAEDEGVILGVASLRKKCFLLVHRIFSGKQIPLRLLHWSVLADICHAYSKSNHLRALLQSLCKQKSAILEKDLQVMKASLIKILDSKRPEDAEKPLAKFMPLSKISSFIGGFMLTGSDFLDSLSSAYPRVSLEFQKKLVTIAYVGLMALLDGPRPNYSVLSDHLYSLKTCAERKQESNSKAILLLTDLVTNTPLLNKIRDSATGPEGARVRNTAGSLNVFVQSPIARPKKLVCRKIDKGKGKVQDKSMGEIHIHRMSLIRQIQDLFPELGCGFIIKMLDEYGDDVEEVTTHLLEVSLPPHLANADRAEQLHITTSISCPHLSPHSTPPPKRRNVFDSDEFDNLAVDMSRLHIGRKNERLTADKLLESRTNAPNKSAILSALAAFDADDDERDDTYDVEDVGGILDSAVPPTDELDAHEEDLFRTYSTNPSSFGRDANIRRSKERAALKTVTGMTDEAIEGWAVMLQRDPRRLRRLEVRYSIFSGQKTTLASTSYRRSPVDSGTEGDEASEGGQRSGRDGFSGRQGRGRGRGWGRRGGGPSDDKSKQALRQQKEANKGSRANHNRRDQRVKKIAGVGFAG